jgi:hypothetical protein
MDDLLSPKEAAESLGVDPRTLRNWRTRGLINAVMVADRPRYRRSDLETVQRPPMGNPNWQPGKSQAHRKKVG